VVHAGELGHAYDPRTRAITRQAPDPWNDEWTIDVPPVVTRPCRVLLISGSLRGKSTNTAVLRTAQAFAPAGVEAVLYDGVRELPHFDPDLDVEPLPQPVAAFRAQFRIADALVFSTPEYAGALPGSFKNALDWTIGDDQPGSIYEKPVAWINASPRGAVHAHDSLRLVLGYAHADVVESACAHVAVNGADVGDDGLIGDASARDQIVDAIATLADRACRRGREVP
jgi:NAD(P)H-dependent FMN reductase